MKKILVGGFLSLIGSIWTLAIAIIAGNNLVSSWTNPPGRFLTTVSEMELIFVFGLSIFLVIVGILIMVIEFFKKDK
ncbi:MAG: hypothetical protein GX285_01025 [Clostridiales bacterium]|nr:hypothetical protein [Clostridiales bacterium]